MPWPRPRHRRSRSPAYRPVSTGCYIKPGYGSGSIAKRAVNGGPVRPGRKRGEAAAAGSRRPNRSAVRPTASSNPLAGLRVYVVARGHSTIFGWPHKPLMITALTLTGRCPDLGSELICRHELFEPSIGAFVDPEAQTDLVRSAI